MIQWICPLLLDPSLWSSAPLLTHLLLLVFLVCATEAALDKKRASEGADGSHDEQRVRH